MYTKMLSHPAIANFRSTLEATAFKWPLSGLRYDHNAYFMKGYLLQDGGLIIKTFNCVHNESPLRIAFQEL